MKPVVFVLALAGVALAQDPGPSPAASLGCVPHGDHWHCDGPTSAEATATGTSNDSASSSATPTEPSPSESVGCEPHNDHWHCDGPAETESGSASSSASASASAGADSGAEKVYGGYSMALVGMLFGAAVWNL